MENLSYRSLSKTPLKGHYITHSWFCIHGNLANTLQHLKMGLNCLYFTAVCAILYLSVAGAYRQSEGQHSNVSHSEKGKTPAPLVEGLQHMNEDKPRGVMIYLSKEDEKRLAVLKETMELTSISGTVRQIIREKYKELIKEDA